MICMAYRKDASGRRVVASFNGGGPRWKGKMEDGRWKAWLAGR